MPAEPPLTTVHLMSMDMAAFRKDWDEQLKAAVGYLDLYANQKSLGTGDHTSFWKGYRAALMACQSILTRSLRDRIV